MSHFDTAEVCEAGHPSTASVQENPEFTSAFCGKCGATTLRACRHCKAPIRGLYQYDGPPMPVSYHAPNYCTSCGKPFPWTERRIETATALSAEAGALTEAETKQFRESLSAIGSDTPETPLAASRLKRFLRKLGPEIGGAVRSIAVEIASEAAKKIILG